MRPGDPKPEPILKGDPSSGNRTFACPETPERHQNEFNAWKKLGNWSTSTNQYRKSGPSRLLRIAMAGRGVNPPTTGRATWDAHHIIPAAEPSPIIRNTIAAVFRCRIYPNLSGNGVYLRSRYARRGTRRFDAIGDSTLQDRTWHPLTYGANARLYFTRLRRSLTAGIGPRGDCSRPQVVANSIGRVGRALLRGDYVPKSLEPSA